MEARRGLIDLPALGERTVGWKGGGVRRNGAPLRFRLSNTGIAPFVLGNFGVPIPAYMEAPARL